VVFASTSKDKGTSVIAKTRTGLVLIVTFLLSVMEPTILARIKENAYEVPLDKPSVAALLDSLVPLVILT